MEAIPIEKNELTKRLKAIRREITAGMTDKERVAALYGEAFAEYEEGGREPSVWQMAHVGASLEYLAENLDRMKAEWAAASRSRTEWEAMEREHIDHDRRPARWMSRETAFDLIAPPRGEITQLWYDYHTATNEMDKARLAAQIRTMCDEIDKGMAMYRDCSYVFCGGVFVPDHGHQRYCCEAHKQAQANAVRRFKATGTYLPEDAYIPKRGASVEKAYQQRETVTRSTDYDAIERKIAKTGRKVA